MNLTENFSKELVTAIDASNAAARLIRSYFKGNFNVDIKEDMTPVTEVDIKAENTIKDIILNAFPDYGFYGEETCRENKNSEYTWLVDPIDGTKGFVRGYPFFSTQIALMHHGEIILGVSNAPIFDEIIFAEKGKGAWMNNKQMHISNTKDIVSSTISTGNLKTIALSENWMNLGKIVSKADRIRGYGDFYHYHLLASGKIDVVIESDVNILDVAALSLIIEESGGVFTDFQGKRSNLDTTSVIASNPNLYSSIKKELIGN
ncbi:MAG: inositol monophosphatase family protein [Woeseiaceae bacterium]|tara:strand:+ start:381 stop:1163 length:783 start_codon:yes stop_codon:yes gene_type:complete